MPKFGRFFTESVSIIKRTDVEEKQIQRLYFTIATKIAEKKNNLQESWEGDIMARENGWRSQHD